ncbi:MAG: hypothetical protein ACLFQB_05535 [Chitinispirillaceae bacterium]
MIKTNVLIATLIAALLASCAGGFGTDSETAKELEDPIFGSDSTD